MSTPSPAWQFHYHLMLLHPTEPRILLQSEPHGWRLPSFRRDEPADRSDICAAMQRQLGLDSLVLYCVSQQVDRAHARQEMIYVLELRSPAWIPPANSRWLDRTPWPTWNSHSQKSAQFWQPACTTLKSCRHYAHPGREEAGLPQPSPGLGSSSSA